ncbi:MAG: hypothetical protein VX252_06980 [Myxococcota bacterium]|nr:hypothetical protein [Myxococcota bacterium]
MRNRIGFAALTCLTLLVALLASLGLGKVLDEAGVSPPRTNLDVLELFQSRLARVNALHGIAYLGDSTGMSGEGSKYSIPGRVESVLQKQPGLPPVVSLAEAGLGPMDFYLLAAEVAEARPAAVIVSVNMAALSHVWAQRLSHPEFASVIGSSRWLEAFGLPTVVSGVKADRLLLYPGLEALGLRGVWQATHQYQAQVLQGWRELGAAMGPDQGPWRRPGSSALAVRSTDEMENQRALFDQALRAQQWNRYGKAIGGVEGDDPSIQIMAAALRHWASLDIPVLVVVIPVNIELVESLGLDDPEGRERTVSTLAEIARGSGARFLDLHDLLPEESFADWHGHYSLSPTPDGPSVIANRVAPVLVSMIQEDR